MPERLHRASMILDSSLRGNDFDIQQIACHAVANRFADVSKTIPLPKGVRKEISDLMLTRYACCPIIQNGDLHKVEPANFPVTSTTTCD